MNHCNCCLDYVCTSSGCKQACKRHDIGTQCGATATNIAAETIRSFDAKSNQQNQQNQQNFQKSPRQLVVTTNQADEFPDDLDGKGQVPNRNLPAACVPSKIPKWRTPPFMNICIQEHHITPHMLKVNLMSKFNTLPVQDLNAIEKFLDI